MRQFRTNWLYSTGLALVWAVVLLLVLTIRGRASAHTALLVFLGYGRGWASTTIARYVYPPPKRWRSDRPQK